MHRPGADPNNLGMADVLCDFCGTPWAHDRPMVEGHRGSCICARCLSVAYTQVVLDHAGEPPRPLPDGLTITDLIPGAPQHAGPASEPLEPCCLCLNADPDQLHYRSPRADEPGFAHKLVCRRCLKMAAVALGRDPDTDWATPRRS